MADMHALVRLMREVEDQLASCMRCGMCQSVCPLYAQTGREADVARGKLALLDGLLREMFDRPDSVRERLDRCLLCGSCQAGCPSGVRVMDIFIKARAILAGFSGLSLSQKMIFKGMLAHPALFDQLTFWSSRFQKLLTRPVNEMLGTSCARVMSPLIGDRHFKPLADRPFHHEVPFMDTPAGRSGRKVAFFVGCLLDKIFPKVAGDVVTVLEKAGVGLLIPQGQACCGIPALSAGDTQTFQKLLRHNLERFPVDDFDYLVTACATCTSTIKKLWPLMAEKEDAETRRRVDRIAEKTLDISQFLIDEHLLTDVPSGGHAPKPTEVTYHDPCHLKKSLGVSAQPRAVLNAIEGIRFVEMEGADQCCGMGGSFNLKYYDISRAIGERKRQAIQASRCSVVATSCPACMMQISDVLSRGGDSVRVRHVVELLAEFWKDNDDYPSAH